MDILLSSGIKCHLTTNEENDAFVGIVVNKGEVKCNFPIGYSLSNDENGIKNDLKLLIKTLSKFSDLKEKRALNRCSKSNYKNVFPLNACIHILSYYYSNGYFVENTQINKRETIGKVNWSKTLNSQKGFIENDSIIFLSFIVSKKMVNESAIITAIHKYCVFESFKLVGFLFDLLPPKNYEIKLQKEEFLFYLKKKLSLENKDKNKILFSAMIDLIEYTGDLQPSDKVFWGVNDFSHVWERMINFLYGENKSPLYFPKTYWNLKDKGICAKSSLEPDTIMISDNGIYIIDAKYYKYSLELGSQNLPMATSISKQIIYGEYVKNNLHIFNIPQQFINVFNIFMLPYNKNKSCLVNNDVYSFFGFANGNWIKKDDTSTTILGILVDVKWLMGKNIKHSQKDIKTLAEFVIKHCPIMIDI